MESSNQLNLQKYRIVPWFARKGDTELRLNYPLNSNSIVFDVGGYLGNWTADVYEKYKCEIHVFEPVKEFYDKMVERFKGNQKIHVYHFGLGGKTRTEQVSLLADSTSVYKADTKSETIKLVDIKEFVTEKKIDHIDMMEINIEGGEYELLDRMIQSGVIKMVTDLQVQFHDFVEDAEAKMLALQSRLRASHFPTYHYKFIWDNWHLKPELKNLDEAKSLISQLENQLAVDMAELDVAHEDAVELRIRLESLEKELAELKVNLRMISGSKSFKLGHTLLHPKSYLRYLLSKRS